jgi:glycosyltransferase involved in cell wall biosynthesis
MAASLQIPQNPIRNTAGPVSSHPGTLALVVIARNEAHCIARCLQSAAGLVDKIILLDTGSTDDTVAIALALGAEVHSFDWIDDFAAARNAALTYSDAHWNLILDADEWIMDVPRGLRAALPATGGFVGTLAIASAFDLAGTVQTSTNWISRLLPAGVRYAGRIHEQVNSTLPRLRLEIRVEHDGYREQQQVTKAGRNDALLAKALEETPDDGYLLYQAGKELEIKRDFESALHYYSLSMENTASDQSYRHDLVVRTIYTLKKLQLHELAISVIENEYDNWQHSPDFFFVTGDVHLDYAVARPDIALDQLLPVAETSWLQCLQLGECADLDGTVMGRGSFLAAHNLAVLYSGIGDKQRSDKYRRLAQRK